MLPNQETSEPASHERDLEHYKTKISLRDKSADDAFYWKQPSAYGNVINNNKF